MSNFHEEEEACEESVRKKVLRKRFLRRGERVKDHLHNSRRSNPSYINNLDSKLGCGQK